MPNRPESSDPPADDVARTLAVGASLESVMADYVQRIEEGQEPSPDEYLRVYPQHADELQRFFRNHHWLSEAPPPQSPTLVGTRIGHYEIEAEIARGGMGVVYRARQQGLERPVALKLISSGVLAGDEERHRFRIEAEAAATSSNSRKSCSGAAPSSASMIWRTTSGGSAGVPDWSFANSSVISGPTRSGRVLRICPSLMNVVPSSVNASRICAPRVNSLICWPLES